MSIMTETNMLQCLASFVIPGVAELEKSYKKVAKSLTSSFSLVNYFITLVCN